MLAVLRAVSQTVSYILSHIMLSLYNAFTPTYIVFFLLLCLIKAEQSSHSSVLYTHCLVPAFLVLLREPHSSTISCYRHLSAVSRRFIPTHCTAFHSNFIAHHRLTAYQTSPCCKLCHVANITTDHLHGMQYLVCSFITNSFHPQQRLSAADWCPSSCCPLH